MKTIRLGNDIVVRWSILRNGIADDLSAIGKPITVIVSGLGEEKRIENYAIEGNVISFKLYGRDLQTPGIYRLTYIENEGLPEMYSVDCNRAFRISGAGQATGGEDTGNITTETIELSSEVTAPADGLSAYEVAVANGYVGSVEDWLQSLRGEKMTYADLTDSDKQDLYAGGASLITPLIDTKQDVIEDLDLIRNGAYKGDTALQPISLITYSNLVSLRDSNRLIPGMQYRITDYACTTTQENTQSAGHPFDIIVIADSENTLNEEARAVQHEGDTYFADSNLSAWKIWYCIDNDTFRFAWADSTNGKGVIYRMIDEWNNDVPYDFKNIMYNGSWGYWAYTFNWINDDSDNTCEDLSVSQYAHINDEGGYSHTYCNIIKQYGGDDSGNYGYPYQLNACVFLHKKSHDGGWFYGCNSNTFGDGCYNNTFSDGCYNNTFGNNCSANTFGGSCNSNTFGSSCSANTFGESCNSNIFGHNCSFNIFGNNCDNNTFGNNCIAIRFALEASSATKYNYYKHNHFGDGCRYILFRGTGTASSSAQVQNYNFAQGLQGTSSIYLTIDGLRELAYETKVAKNSAGELKIYCEADLIQ